MFLSAPQPKFWVSCHQRVAIILLGALSPSWSHSHSLYSSFLVNLFHIVSELYPLAYLWTLWKIYCLILNAHNLTHGSICQLNFALLPKKKVHNLCHLFYWFLRGSVVKYYLRHQVLRPQYFWSGLSFAPTDKNTLIHWVVAFAVFAVFCFCLYSLIIFVDWNLSIIFV